MNFVSGDRIVGQGSFSHWMIKWMSMSVQSYCVQRCKFKGPKIKGREAPQEISALCK